MNDKNYNTLREYYNDLGMSVIGGTLNCQLYLDLDDGELMINHEASSNTWLQRDDGSLVCLHKQDSNSDWGNIDDVDSNDYREWMYYVLGEYEDAVA
jgi:hypothetical protein